MNHGKRQHLKQPLGGTAYRQHKHEALVGPCFYVCVCVCLNASACMFVQDLLLKPAHLDLVAVKYNLTRDASEMYLIGWADIKRYNPK